MSAKSPLVHVRLSDKILNQIDCEIETANRKSAARPWTRSSWIRHAIEYQLEIQRQRRRVRGPKKLVCATCGKKMSEEEIAYKVKPLFGENEHYCISCNPRTAPE